MHRLEGRVSRSCPLLRASITTVLGRLFSGASVVFDVCDGLGDIFGGGERTWAIVRTVLFFPSVFLMRGLQGRVVRGGRALEGFVLGTR